MRLVLETVMQQELNDFLNALPGERTEAQRGYRNGYYERDLVTGIGKLEAVQVPRDCAGEFETKVFEQYARNDIAVNAALTEMFLHEVSTSKVGAVTEKLMGLSPSASTVSRLAHDLEAECEEWRNRPLQAHYPVWMRPSRGELKICRGLSHSQSVNSSNNTVKNTSKIPKMIRLITNIFLLKLPLK